MVTRLGRLLLILALLPGVPTLLEGQQGSDSTGPDTGLPVDSPIDPENTSEIWTFEEEEERYDSTELRLRTPAIGTLEEYREDERFNYDLEGDGSSGGIFQRVIEWIAELFDRLFGIGETVESAAGILPYVFFLLALGLLIWTLLKSEVGRGWFRKKGGREGVRFEEEIRDIHALDFPRLIDEAVARNDYRGAVRLHYLELLQRLSTIGSIDWRPEKTNGAYLDELRSHPIHPKMRELTLIFDWVWYGEYLPEAGEYQLFRRDFAQATGMLGGGGE